MLHTLALCGSSMAGVMSLVTTGAYEEMERVTTVPSKYQLHFDATHIFGSSLFLLGVDELSILYTELANNLPYSRKV